MKYLFNLITFVSAHTGNDAYEHGMELFDWFLLVALIIGAIFIVRKFLIKNLNKPFSKSPNNNP